jgi:hypothetical protein
MLAIDLEEKRHKKELVSASTTNLQLKNSLENTAENVT